MSINTMRGATIPELIVMVAVAGILVGLLFGPLNDLYTSNTSGLTSVVQTADTRGALRTIEQDVTYASKFLSENDIDDLSGNIPGKPGVKWAWTGNPSADTAKRVLIIQAYGTTTQSDPGDAGTREIVFNTSDCTKQIPLTINFAFYVQDGNLYKRTLKKSGTNTGCNSKVIGQKRSCYPTYVNGGSCEAKDALILQNVTGFDVHYYLDSSQPTAITDEYTDGSKLTNATSVVISVTTTTGAGTNAKNVTSNMRITRIN